MTWKQIANEREKKIAILKRELASARGTIGGNALAYKKRVKAAYEEGMYDGTKAMADSKIMKDIIKELTNIRDENAQLKKEMAYLENVRKDNDASLKAMDTYVIERNKKIDALNAEIAQLNFGRRANELCIQRRDANITKLHSRLAFVLDRWIKEDCKS